MTNDRLIQLLHERIVQKKSDLEWDQTIAQKVFERRKNSRKKLFYSLSASSLAAAAIIIFVFLFSFNKQSDQIDYYSFISSQIDGTATMAFKSNEINQNNDNISSIDNMIIDTLAIR